MTWHADETLLARYVTGGLDDAHASSLEAHLIGCDLCRGRVSHHAPPDRLDAGWAGVVDRLDAPAPTPVERFLVAVRVPEHIARLLAATPALGVPWLGGVAAALAFVALAGMSSQDARAVSLFLVLAPIVPVVGVAVSYGPQFDPAAELAVAAAMDSFRLLLLRALAIVATTTLLTGLTAAVLPAGGWLAAAWLLPAVALTSATLALGRFIPLQAGAAVLVTGWVVAALASAYPFREVFSAFGPAGQVTCLVVAVVAALFLRRPEAPPHVIPRRP